MTNGKLFLVATPIGNLDDISPRAIKTLLSVDLILAEDTRKTARLLEKVAPGKTIPPLKAFFEANEDRQLDFALEELLAGHNLALVSNAGMPAIADPGFKLVRACRQQGIEVVAIPGPNAAITALALSGLPTDKFIFLGFLPKKKGKIKKILTSYQELSDSPLSATLVFYESPYRLLSTLKLVQEALGNQVRVVVARELTKVYEEIISGYLEEVLLKLADKKIKGEISVVLSFK